MTPSYPQFPFTEFTHLPGVLIGFDRLGPFAVHCGMMVQIAALLAILTQFLVQDSLGVQSVVVALAAGVFSFRISPHLYNLTGYAVPAVCTGMMLLAVSLADVSSLRLFRFVGGLLCLSLLHHYPGVFVVLPVVLLWVVADRHPLRRIRAFVG